MTEYTFDAGDSVILLVVVVGMLLDRALAVIFEHSRFLDAGYARHRYLITLGVSIALAASYRIDVFAHLAHRPVSIIGIALTGLFVASVSTATARVITDLFQIRSRAQDVFQAQRRG